MQRKIVAFHQDADGVWVAELECTHRQHMRHNPPWQERAWVMTESGRQEKLGAELECFNCNMAALPEDVKAYRQTAKFDETSLPDGLLADHHLKAGTWGRIVVEEGKLSYTTDRGTFVLMPGVVGIIEPEVSHHVRPLGKVVFYVEFLKRPSDA